MNKEYIYLSDKEILVTDENGHAVKRDIVSTDMHEILLLENDLEKINSAISNMEEIIDNEEESKLSIKGKIVLAIMPFVVGMSIYGIAYLIDPIMFSNLFLHIISCAVVTIAIDVGFLIATRHYKNHINGVKSELTRAYQLKEELKQSLSNIKVKSKDSIATNIVKSQENNLKINDVIILEETTPFCEDAEKQLEQSYEAGFNQKEKKLILKK